MQIDRRTLNLVLTVEDDEGGVLAHVHATPIGRETFERYYDVLTQTYAAMMERGVGWMALNGQKVAALMLRDVAKANNAWEGQKGVEAGLLAEIRRLANVMTLGPNGWQLTPLQVVLDQGQFEEEDAAEVESACVFFTVLSSAMSKKGRKAAFGMFDGRLTSSTASEYRSSLPISRPDEPTGEKATRSSIPR
jgi:hypothetical protein